MKKLSKLVLIILVLSLCCTVLCGFAVGNKKLQETIENQTEHFAGGSGTESDPYQISTAKQLQKLSDIINLDYPNKYQNAYREAYYKLTANIDLGGKKSPWTPIGSPDTNSPGFNGHFDGDGHTISGIYIKSRDGLTKENAAASDCLARLTRAASKTLQLKTLI